jgi:hypothetical protein
MSYNVLFVGLCCFTDAEPGVIRAFLPDGRIPPSQYIPAHLASISVRPDDVVAMDGWADGDVVSSETETEFFFPPSVIDFSSANGTELSTGQLSDTLWSLTAIDRRFRLNPDGQWIASVTFGSGELHIFFWPVVANYIPGTAPALIQWPVPHPEDENVVVTLTARADGSMRTITLIPNTEIALVNTSRGEPPRGYDDQTHFQIYSVLSSDPVTLVAPPRLQKLVDVWKSPRAEEHPFFTSARAALSEGGCTGVTR